MSSGITLLYQSNSNNTIVTGYLYNGIGPETVIIPSTVTAIGDFAFQQTSLTAIIFSSNSVTSIGMYAFYMCQRLTSITIPSSVTSIGIAAFLYCIKLSSITLPSFITSIDSEVFSTCTKLTSISIPSSVTSVDEKAFNSCLSLTSVIINSSSTIFSGVYAFYECDNNLTIIFSNSVTAINNNAYNGFNFIKNIIISDSVTSIGISAFQDCPDITSIALQRTYTQGLTTLNTDCFLNINMNNSSLQQMYLQGYSIAQLTTAGFNTPALNLVTGGVVITGNIITSIPAGVTELIIPSNVTSISSSTLALIISTLTKVNFSPNINILNIDGLFQNCTVLTSVSIPASVTSLGANTFSGCTALKNVTVSSNASNVSSTAFTGCSNVNLVISSESNKIANYFLMNVTQVSSVTISAGITTMGKGAFKGCTNLKTIIYA
jgi:hypothetical protein